MKYTIRLANMVDKEQILKIWNDKKNKPNLSIPFNCEIDKCINQHRMYVVVLKDDIIGFGAYQIMKKEPEIRIKHLCVDEKYRRNGVAINIIFRIATDLIDIDLPLVAICRDGADNNNFYEKYKKENYTTVSRKTLNCRRYVMDKDKIMEMCDNGI